MSAVVALLPSISQTLVDGLCRPNSRGVPRVGVIHELWRRLVFREIDTCADRVDTLTPRHRSNACSLVDWYHREFGNVPSNWLVLYRSPAEMYRRYMVAELDWCAANVASLSPRHRDKAIDLIETALEEFGEYHSWWSVLHW